MLTRFSRICLLIIAPLLFFAGCAKAPSTPTPVAAVQPAPAEPPFPAPVIDLRGDNAQIGTQHATQLSEPIRELHQKYLVPYFQSQTQRLIALTAASVFEAKMLPEHQTELKALAAAVPMDEREAMLAQCFLDLSSSLACSTITLPASASPDGVARFGRNLDFPSLDVADKHTVVLIYHRPGRYQFAAIGWPGLVGVLSGMNEHGLTLANMEVARGPKLPTAMPYTLLYRTILEQCKDVDEAIALLQRTPRQTANNLMLMDAAGNRAVVEIRPEQIHVRRGLDGSPLISTNHQRDQDGETPGRCPRYDFLHAQSSDAFGHLDVPALEQMLAGAAQGKMTLQSMVFEPSRCVLYLSVGANAPTHPFGRLDLKKHFTSDTVSSAIAP